MCANAMQFEFSHVHEGVLDALPTSPSLDLSQLLAAEGEEDASVCHTGTTAPATTSSRDTPGLSTAVTDDGHGAGVPQALQVPSSWPWLQAQPSNALGTFFTDFRQLQGGSISDGTQTESAHQVTSCAMGAVHGGNEKVDGAKSRGRGRPSKPRLSDLQEELEQRLAQYKQLAEQNAFLKNKLKLLEMVVPARDESVGFLTHASGLVAAAAASSSSSGNGAGSSSSGNTAPPPASPHFEYCPTVHGHVPAITSEAIEQLRKTTPRQFQELWAKIVLELGVHVLGVEAHGTGSPHYVKMVQYLTNVMQYLDRITLLAPDTFLKSLYVNVETGVAERPPDVFWSNVARALGLSTEQKAEISSVMSVYECSVAPVIEERRRLSEQLSSAVQMVSPISARSTALGGIEAMAALEELTQLLARNVLKEHTSHWDVGDFMCFSVLSPFQVAKALAISYPYIPDGVAVLHAVHAVHEEGQAASPVGIRAGALNMDSGAHGSSGTGS